MKLSFISKLILIFVVYFITGKLGLSQAVVNSSVTPIWAPVGIAIVSMVFLGIRIWPIIFISAFFTNFISTGFFYSSLGISIGNTLEAVIGTYLIKKFVGINLMFDRPRNIFKFLVIVSFSAIISATWGLSSLLLFGDLINNEILIWITWWLGNVSGALLIIPFIYIWISQKKITWNPDRKLEAVVVLLSLIIISGAVFNGLFINIQQTYPIAFLCVPILVWVALRFDQKITSLSVIVLAVISIWGTVNNLGTFSQYDKSYSLILLQLFLSIVGITSILISALVKERESVKGLFQNTLDNMSEGFQIIGYDMKYLYVNDAVAMQGKRRKEELLGHSLMEMYPGIEKTKFFEYLQKAMIDQIPQEMENEFKFPDGSRGWFALKIEPINEGVIILSVDITEEKRNQQKLAQDKAEDDALLDSIGDGIIATDSKGRIIRVNSAFEQMLGFKQNELVGINSFDKLLMEDENKKVLQDKDRPLTKAFQLGEKVTEIYYLVRKDGTKFLARVAASPIILEGKIVGAVKVFHDITVEREIEEMKSEFVSLASHELRTPLSVVKGFVSMIRDGDYGVISEEFKKPLERIAVSTEKLIKIVNEMIDVSRIDIRKVELNVQPISIMQLIDQAYSEYNDFADSKNIEFIITKKTHIKILTDREKSLSILRNLIENAIIYTNKGSVKIAISKNDSFAEIRVIDTGIGISQNNLKKLFNKFEQVKAKKTGTSGIGLGLYISREMARLMKGDLKIEKTVVGQGSTFVFILPIYKQGMD